MFNATNFKALNDRLLVKVMKEEEKSDGFIITSKTNTNFMKGRVISTAKPKTIRDEYIVYFERSNSVEIDNDYRIIKEEDILGFQHP